ncbi:MAG: kelch repeat-containing protein [Bacillota bacterium]|nr:kelch repeat-containing protein [Bacillota bacterium]
MVNLIRSRLKLTPERRRKLVSWVTILSFLGACLFMAFWKDTKKAEASAVSHVGFFMWPSTYISGDYVPATGKIYVNAGSNQGFANSHIFEFNPNPPYPITWRETQGYFSGNVPHMGATAGTIGGNVFWLGGYEMDGLDDIHRFTPPDTMERVGYLPEDRCLAADTTYNGKIYMVGGKARDYTSVYYDNILSFDGQTVQVEGTLPFPRHNGDAAVSNDGKLLIFGGYNSAGMRLNDILQFDFVTGQCSQIGTLPPGASGGLRAARVGESIYIFIPGDSSNCVTEIYEFCEGELYLLSVTIPERLSGTCPIVVGNKIFLFGGMDPVTAECTMKIWMLDTTQIPPGKVTITSSQQGNSVSLTWAPVPHASLYHVEHSTDQQNWSEVSVTAETHYSATLSPGKHYYRVRAENESGVMGEYSNVVSVTVLPEPPAGLQAWVDGKTVTLNWQAVSGAGSYLVQRSTNGTNWSQIAEVSETSCTDTGTTWNTNYYYRVIAKTSDGVMSNPSNSVQVSTANVPPPAGLNVTINGTKVSLTWQSVEGASSYIVERSLDGRTWSETAAVGSPSYLDQSTQPNTVYYYRVRAKSGNSVSDPSEVKMIKTFEDPPPPPQVVSGLTATWCGDFIRVTWNRGQNQLPAGWLELWKQTGNGVWLPVKEISEAEKDSFIWDDMVTAPGLNCRYELRYLGGLSAGYTWYKVAESGWATGERPLPAPGGLWLTVGQSSATVTWEAVSGATSYTVQYSTNGGTTWQSLTVTGTSATVPRRCIARVRAGNHSRSQWSGNVTVP